MRDYHEYEKIFVGSSDVAALVAVGCQDGVGVYSQVVKMGGDGAYIAYLVDEDAVIGEHYEKVLELECWMKLYDDTSLVFDKNAKHFNVYRAGDCGLIIQVIK